MTIKLRPRDTLGSCGLCANSLGLKCYHWEGNRYCSKVCWSLANPQAAQAAEQAEKDPFNGAKFPERVYD